MAKKYISWMLILVALIYIISLSFRLFNTQKEYNSILEKEKKENIAYQKYLDSVLKVSNENLIKTLELAKQKDSLILTIYNDKVKEVDAIIVSRKHIDSLISKYDY